MPINLNSAPYSDIIAFAEQHGYRRSVSAINRESEGGSIGQYGITLDEACDFIRAKGLDDLNNLLGLMD